MHAQFNYCMYTYMHTDYIDHLETAYNTDYGQ